MCGIAGYLSYSKNYETAVITAMSNALEHRGPDDHGVKVFNESDFQLALGHH
ncbi:MAG: hypothetical protein KC469_06005 [Flavobacteriaceae bacterium]|nr:hypothetical protein [Flavobacteriaceae bacterium]